MPIPCPTLKKIIRRGTLRAGVSQGIRPLSYKDNLGIWRGFDVDFAQAVAAATLGDKGLVEFIPLAPQDRFTSLAKGDVDILTANATGTLSRDIELGITFVGVIYYDSEGFLSPKKLKINNILEIDEPRFAIQAGTTTAQNLSDFFSSRQRGFSVRSFATPEEAMKEYLSGQYHAYVLDRTALAAERNQLSSPDDHIILPDMISKEPMGPFVAEGDEKWWKIVRWVFYALIMLEEVGVSSSTIQSDTVHQTIVARIQNKIMEATNVMTLPEDWISQIALQTGNYGELFDRHFGVLSELKLPRALNDLWSRGGLIYAPPFN
ncbi:MAG: amino acid ABC transporter substrate-binding protein [Alphaproteobacteria bacterium]|nr:amino acid ABC transporter substrate-binding protein [Alphaproteobacteria bacterium]